MGKKLEPFIKLLEEYFNNANTSNYDKAENGEIADCIIEYQIDHSVSQSILQELSMLGVSHSTIFPDLDHLGRDIAAEMTPEIGP